MTTVPGSTHPGFWSTIAFFFYWKKKNWPFFFLFSSLFSLSLSLSLTYLSLGKDCPQGQYGDREASIAPDNPSASDDFTCLPCVSGKVGLATQLATRNSCTDCPIGKWLATPGQTTLDECILCGQGKYTDQTGLYMEQQCTSFMVMGGMGCSARHC